MTSERRFGFVHPFVSKKAPDFLQGSGTHQLCRRTAVFRSRPVFVMSENSKATPDYFYFGYGSNMSRSKMRGRGFPGNNSDSSGIEFTDVWVGRLADWQLCMNLGGSPPSEPAFGNIRPSKGDEVYGVVYRIRTEASWESLKRSEGVRDQSESNKSTYHMIQVNVECFSRDSPNQKTLRTVNTLMLSVNRILPRRLEDFVFPSSRYMNLLISGAKEEGLPQDYIRHLELMPIARKWNSSVLPEMSLLLTVLFFNLARVGKGHLLKPFRVSVLYLYAFHESFARKERTKHYERAIMFFCKMAMLCVLLIPNLATVLLFVGRRQSWETYQRFRRRRAGSIAPKTLTKVKAP